MGLCWKKMRSSEGWKWTYLFINCIYLYYFLYNTKKCSWHFTDVHRGCEVNCFGTVLLRPLCINISQTRNKVHPLTNSQSKWARSKKAVGEEMSCRPGIHAVVKKYHSSYRKVFFCFLQTPALWYFVFCLQSFFLCPISTSNGWRVTQGEWREWDWRRWCPQRHLERKRHRNPKLNETDLINWLLLTQLF